MAALMSPPVAIRACRLASRLMKPMAFSCSSCCWNLTSGVCTCEFPLPAKSWIICCMSCCWALGAPVGEDVAGGAGEEVGASGTGPTVPPAEGAGVRDIPKEPRLRAGETKRWEMASEKGMGT